MLITEPPGQLHPKLSLFFTETAAGRGPDGLSSHG